MDRPQSDPDEVDPAEAYDLLSESEDAVLIDVRTRQEWAGTGVPDVSETGCPLWTVEWITLPERTLNMAFLEELEGLSAGAFPARMFFICKSGVRSMAAAGVVCRAAAERGESVKCWNVAEGFEGNMHPSFAAGGQNGWRSRGLPCRQFAVS